jgi:predicted dehydrogenase
MTAPLRLGIIGLSHGHVEWILSQAPARDDIELVGIAEADAALADRLARKHGFDRSLLSASADEMLEKAGPEAVSVMTPISGHVAAVEACAARGVPTLLEKPLAFSSEHAQRIAELSRTHNTMVLTNYETSWYASLRHAHAMLASMSSPLRKMVFRHGHRGPVELGCAPEFLAWLTDPARNGGGALTDFGCYGLAISTWLQEGRRPVAMTASAATLKPDIYPFVDDDATITLTYPGATAVIQASWAWTHDTKEADFYTDGCSLHAGRGGLLTRRLPDGPEERLEAPPLPSFLADEWTYLRQVVRGECPVDPLSGLEFNVVVAELLDAARGLVRGRRAQ